MKKLLIFFFLLSQSLPAQLSKRTSGISWDSLVAHFAPIVGGNYLSLSDTLFQIRTTRTPVIGNDTLATKLYARSQSGGGGSSTFVPSPDEYVCGNQYVGYNKPYYADTAIQTALNDAYADGKKRVKLLSSIPNITGNYILLQNGVDIVGLGDTLFCGITNYLYGTSFDVICNVTVKAIVPTFGYAIYMRRNGPGAASVIRVKADVIDCWSINQEQAVLQGCGTLYVDCDYVTSGTAFGMNAGIQYINAKVVNAHFNYTFNCSDGNGAATQYVHCDSVFGFEPLNGMICVDGSTAKQYLWIGVAVSPYAGTGPSLASGYVFSAHEGALQYVYGGKFVQNNLGTSGVAQVTLGGIMQLQNCILLDKNPSGYSVDSPNAQNVYVLGTVATNQAVSSNITQKVGTITVSADVPGQ